MITGGLSEMLVDRMLASVLRKDHSLREAYGVVEI